MTQLQFKTLAQAVEAYYEDLRRFVRRRTGSDNLADDVVHDTWLRASATKVAMPDNARAYVFRMAGNLAVDHMKREGVRSDRETELDNGIPSGRPGVEDEAIARQEFAILIDAVRELPPRRRCIFILYRGHGLTMREIAERLGISQKTVQKQVSRAMVHCEARMRAAGREIRRTATYPT